MNQSAGFQEEVFEPQQRKRENGHGASKPRFKLKSFEAIILSTGPEYLVKGIIPRTGLIVVWGPPKCGKSFWTFDLMMHVALGWEYRGHRVQQGPVVYLALEGGQGFSKRVEAWRRKHPDYIKQSPVPFSLLDVSVNLIADHPLLIAEICEQNGNQLPAVVVIDTLNRALVGDENKSDDMAKFIRAADLIRTTFNCAVIIVHHCGIAKDRPRGHTSLSGADDASVAVVRDETGNIVSKVEHMKDAEAGAIVVSRLEPEDLGTDDDGDEITSCVIVPVEGELPGKSPKLGGLAKLALDGLRELIAEAGEPAPASNHIPLNVRVCSTALWREHFYAVHPGKPDAKQKAFVRACLALKVADQIGIWQDNVWIAAQAGHARTNGEMSG